MSCHVSRLEHGRRRGSAMQSLTASYAAMLRYGVDEERKIDVFEKRAAWQNIINVWNHFWQLTNRKSAVEIYSRQARLGKRFWS